MATRPVIEASDCTVSGSNTEQASWAVSYPNASAGDLLIFNVGWDDSTATTSCSAPAGPNGEVAHAIAGPVASNSTEVRGQAWYYVATGTWTASTLTFTPSATESWSATCIKVLAGEFDPNTPIGASETAASAGTAETSVASPAFTAGSTDSDGCLVWFAAVDTDPLSATNPTGWTIRQRQDLGAVAHGIATRDSAVTNSESITAGSWGIAGDSWASIAYVVRAPSRTYYVVYPSADSAPSATQIKAGQKSSGAAATAAGNELSRSTTGEEVFASAATGLTAGTTYKLSLVINGSGGDSNVVTSAAWVTDTAVALTGSAATTSAGTVVSAVAAAVAGSAVAASAGTLTPVAEYSAALTGEAVTASAGTLAPDSAQPIAGSEVTASAGTLTPDVSYLVALTGESITVSAGTLSPVVTAAIAGEAATVSAGTLAPATTAAASGAEVAASAGTVGVAVEVAASGSEVATSAGTLTPETEADITVALTGSAVTASAGTLSAAAVLGLTGSEVGTAAGTIVASAGESIAYSGGWVGHQTFSDWTRKRKEDEARDQRRDDELEDEQEQIEEKVEQLEEKLATVESAPLTALVRDRRVSQIEAQIRTWLIRAELVRIEREQIEARRDKVAINRMVVMDFLESVQRVERNNRTAVAFLMMQ